MPYSAEISRTNPACVLVLVDQSGSMDEPFAGQEDKKKSEGVADAVNRLLQNMVLKCAKADGVRDYFHVGVIGYGGARHQRPHGDRSTTVSCRSASSPTNPRASRTACG